jgi:hypothetical protein
MDHKEGREVLEDETYDEHTSAASPQAPDNKSHSKATTTAAAASITVGLEAEAAYYSHTRPALLSVLARLQF